MIDHGWCTGAGRGVATLLLVGIWLGLMASPAVAQAPAELTMTKPSGGERRVALVIGNSDYQAVGKLANPVNDARAMGIKLKKLGFDVIAVENGTQQSMRRAIGQFSNKLAADAVSLFFYAGHGMQVNGHNYLIPVDAEITTEQTVGLETIDVDRVIDQMSMAKSRVNLVILDACRSNPYERRFRSQAGGLASIEAPTGTLIAYATSPGKVAADGDTGNGLYTSELIRAIDVPGAKVEDVFKRVRGNVIARSKGDQTPWEASSLTGDFYFSGPTTVIMAPSTGGAPVDREAMLWSSVKDSRNPALIQTYVDQFPQGVFAGAAKVMIEDLKRNQVASVPAKPDVVPAPAADTALPIEDIEGAYITVKRANVREKPVADAKLVKALDPGVPLTVTGRVKDTQWYRVATVDAKLRGFVFGDAIQDIKAAEDVEWQRVKDAKQSAVVVGFLRRYPAGSYADQAKALRDALAKDETPAAVTPAAMVAPPAQALRPPAPGAAVYPVGVGQSFRDCSDCPELVVIPAGSFTMGSSPAETSRESVPDQVATRERPQHSVRVGSPLAVGKYHVTRGEFARFAQASGYSASGGCSWRDPGFPQTDRDPVVCVNWNDAKAYVQWLSRETGRGYRLLTEAEWEYAARGGTSTARWWGESSADQCRYANGQDISLKQKAPNLTVADCQDGYVYTSPVGSFAPNPFGLYDMQGNASQWVEDCWRDNYDGASGDASIATVSGDCGLRAVRGGSWLNDPWSLRAALRGVSPSGGDRDSRFGFRVARTPAG